MRARMEPFQRDSLRAASGLFDESKEKAFFAQRPWNALPDDRFGIPALRARIQGLLMSRTESEIPKVKDEIAARLKSKKQLAEAIGASHSTPEEQRALLGKVTSRFTYQSKGYALDAYYTRDTVFQEQPDLKLIPRMRELNELFSIRSRRLITRMRELNEVFSKTLHGAGHTRIFVGSESTSASEDGQSEEGTIRDDCYYVDCMHHAQAGFSSRRLFVDHVEDSLFHKGYPMVSITSQRSQLDREFAMRHFRSGNALILVAAGVAHHGHGGIEEYTHRIDVEELGKSLKGKQQEGQTTDFEVALSVYQDDIRAASDQNMTASDQNMAASIAEAL
ncbi:uncharacterized protein F5Z01DRAFT_737539 [Emericellopsis atlantica]|uniref:Dynamin stalk domain-containing protein n=1 Tax=Emericellopsis atlantica TaxID=2614577 RepID=A0A9P8CPW9_9HYPO|nr:uncharacterized protein F5Z01DRAFT_737539 [Emericellopsis atlantica]KAG9253171.1 hypothetical protein F5Z01DRAFT_737539 [Emericellopsis atlantica]